MKKFTHTMSVDAGGEDYVRAEIVFGFFRDDDEIEILSITDVETGEKLDEDSCTIDRDTLATVACEQSAD